MDMQNEIEEVLQQLHYYDLHLVNQELVKNTYVYEGYLDTYYRIYVNIVNNKMEIWDCKCDEENYVKIGIAQKLEGKWLVNEL